MRINKYVAAASELSRRGADDAVAASRVTVNGKTAGAGQDVSDTDVVALDGKQLRAITEATTVLFNKPIGYVVSRDGQGSQTIYDLLPPEYQRLNPVGRLDRNSSGLLLLTNNGQLANELTHPSKLKVKVYEVTLNKSLQPLHRQMISDHGIQLDDGLSKLQLGRMKDGNDKVWEVRMHEGRNRQIRRTFESLGYTIITLHRTHFGNYSLGTLAPGKVTLI